MRKFLLNTSKYMVLPLLMVTTSLCANQESFDKVLKLHVPEDVRIKQEIFEDDILHFFNENEKTNVLLQEK